MIASLMLHLRCNTMLMHTRKITVITILAEHRLFVIWSCVYEKSLIQSNAKRWRFSERLNCSKNDWISYFLKDAICAHVLAYMFECHPNDLWFGSKWRAEQSFAYNTKRGKKANGRVPMSEPALSAYKQKWCFLCVYLSIWFYVFCI